MWGQSTETVEEKASSRLLEHLLYTAKPRRATTPRGDIRNTPKRETPASSHRRHPDASSARPLAPLPRPPAARRTSIDHLRRVSADIADVFGDDQPPR